MLKVFDLRVMLCFGSIALEQRVFGKKTLCVDCTISGLHLWDYY